MPQLTRARDHLRRSVALDSNDPEPRLRLVHVLLELNDIAGAEKEFAGGDWSRATPAFVYIARLLEGTLRERQRDPAAAARSYDAAITLAPQAQSARIARSHLAHMTGARSDAAAFALEAITSADRGSDPWWLYSKGLVWRMGGYLDRQRQLVRR